MRTFSRALVDLILLGPAGDRRQLQDSPILGDVWLAFAAKPSERMDLLITPYRDHPAGPVAKAISRALRDPGEALVAYLQGLVAARLIFRELFACGYCEDILVEGSESAGTASLRGCSREIDQRSRTGDSLGGREERGQKIRACAGALSTLFSGSFGHSLRRYPLGLGTRGKLASRSPCQNPLRNPASPRSSRISCRRSRKRRFLPTNRQSFGRSR